MSSPQLKRGQTSLGNNLPFGGTNILARHILLGQCIIRALVSIGCRCACAGVGVGVGVLV